MKILRILFWLFFILSIILVVAMLVPQFAAFIRVMQLANGSYFGYPNAIAKLSFTMSFISTNLWWILLLCTPFVIFSKSKPVLGMALSVGAFAVLWFLPPIIIGMQSASLIAVTQGNTAPKKITEKINSITIDEDGCDRLCESILLGEDVKIVRTSKPKESHLQHLMFYRASPEQCHKLDPDFPMRTPCILARKDDGNISDLRLERGSVSRKIIKRKDLSFSPKIYSQETLKLARLDSEKTVATKIALTLIEPQGYVPLYANTGFDGRGIHGGGMIPAPQIIKPKNVRSELLSESGIKLGKSRSYKIINKQLKRGVGRGYLESAPYDIALIRSINLINGNYGKTTKDYISSWLARFVSHNFKPNDEEKNLFEELRSVIQETSTPLYLLQAHYPDYFKGGLGSFYTDIESEDKFIQQRAISVIRHNVIYRKSVKQNAAHSDKYLALIKNEVALTHIIPFAGRYGFNPLPILKSYYSTAHIDKTEEANAVLLAACQSDQQWADKLKNFVDSTVLENLKNHRAVSLALHYYRNNQLQTDWDNLKGRLSPKIRSKVRHITYKKSRKPTCFTFRSKL